MLKLPMLQCSLDLLMALPQSNWSLQLRTQNCCCRGGPNSDNSQLSQTLACKSTTTTTPNNQTHHQTHHQTHNHTHNQTHNQTHNHTEQVHA